MYSLLIDTFLNGIFLLDLLIMERAHKMLSWRPLMALRRFGGVDGDGAYWRESLNGSVNGRDLEMCAGARPSYSLTLMFVGLFSFVLVNNFLGLFPYVFTSHLVVTLTLGLSLMFFGWVNHTVHMFAQRAPMWRAGCRMTETTAHIIQGCDRTSDGRVRRHDAVVLCLADDLIKKNMRVELENVYSTSVGDRKPYIVAKDSEGVVWVLDVQIVSALAGLGVVHRNKFEYYKGNSSLVGNIGERFSAEVGSVRVEAITLSWKGEWWYKAMAPLIALGISQKTLNDLTYRR